VSERCRCRRRRLHLKRRRRTTTTTTTLLRLEKPTRGKLWRGGRERNKVWAKGGGGDQ
jgi:hypothetical protein